MEEIEYLEEYEDIVLPAINSAAAVAAANAPKSAANIDDEDSSSSLDQDIFNCLFDDNSDDDNDEQQPQNDETDLNQKRVSRPSLDSIDLLNDLGEQVAKEFELKKTIAAQQSQKTSNSTKKSSSTSRPKTFVTKNSGTTITLPVNRIEQSTVSPKSVATVRPTIQTKELQKKSNVFKLSPLGRQLPRKLTSSVSHTSNKARKPLKINTLTSKSPSSSTTKKSTATPPSKPALIKQRPATIVKPEKIVTKDPPEDPLNLDDLSSSESANYSVSDISGETYNSISDFDDDDYDFTSHIENLDDEDDDSSNSQIIDISNDSSESRSRFEDLRASTPSPVVSDDRDLCSTPDLTKKRSSPKFMANHEIIKSLLTRGENPKLLQLINKHDNADNIDSKDEESPTKTSIGETTVSSPPSEKDTKSITSFLSSQITSSKSNEQRDTTKTISATTMDFPTNSRDAQSPGTISHDSYLSVVNEMLEESYAEAMKSSKHEVLPNQEVGAEMEIGVEETTENDLCREEESPKESTNSKIQKNGTDKLLGEQQSPPEKEAKILSAENKTETNQNVESTDVLNIVNTAEETNVLCAEKTSETNQAVESIKDLSDVNDNKSTEMTNVSPSAPTRKNRFKNCTALEDRDFSQDTLDDEHGFQGFHDDGQKKLTNIETKQTVEVKSNSGDEQQATTSKVYGKKLTTGIFKNPSTTRDKSKEKCLNSSRESSVDRSKESLNKHTTDVPRGVIRNPFVQRTVNKNIKDEGSRVFFKDRPREKHGGDRSRENSRDRSRDVDNYSKIGLNEANLTSKQTGSDKSSISRGTTNKTDSKVLKNSDIDKDKKKPEEKTKMVENTSKEIQSSLTKKQEAIDKKAPDSEPQKTLGRNRDQPKSHHTNENIKRHSIPKETETISSLVMESKDQSKSHNDDITSKCTDYNEENLKEIAKSSNHDSSHESDKEMKTFGYKEEPDTVTKEQSNKSLATIIKVSNECIKVNKTTNNPAISIDNVDSVKKKQVTAPKYSGISIDLSKSMCSIEDSSNTSKLTSAVSNKTSGHWPKSLKDNKIESSIDLSKSICSLEDFSNTSKPTSGVSNTLLECKKTSEYLTKSLKDNKSESSTDLKSLRISNESKYIRNDNKELKDCKNAIKKIPTPKITAASTSNRTLCSANAKYSEKLVTSHVSKARPKCMNTSKTEGKNTKTSSNSINSTKVLNDKKVQIKTSAGQKLNQSTEKLNENVNTDKQENSIMTVVHNVEKESSKESENKTFDLKAESSSHKELKEKRHVRSAYGKAKPQEESKNIQIRFEKNRGSKMLKDITSEEKKAKEAKIGISSQNTEMKPSKCVDIKAQQKESTKSQNLAEDGHKTNKQKCSSFETSSIKDEKSMETLPDNTKYDSSDMKGSVNEHETKDQYISTVIIEPKSSEIKNSKYIDVAKERLTREQIEGSHNADISSETKTEENKVKPQIETSRSGVKPQGNSSECITNEYIEFRSQTPKMRRNMSRETNVDTDGNKVEDMTHYTLTMCNATEEHNKFEETGKGDESPDKNQGAAKPTPDIKQNQQIFQDNSKMIEKIGAKTESINATVSNREDKTENNLSNEDEKQKEVSIEIVRKTRNIKADETVTTVDNPKFLSDGSSSNTDKPGDIKSKEIEDETERNNPQVNSRKTRSTKLGDSDPSAVESKEETTEFKNEAATTASNVNSKLIAHSSNRDDVLQQATSQQMNTSVIKTTEPGPSNSSLIEECKRTVTETNDHDKKLDCYTDTSKDTVAVRPKKSMRKTRSAAHVYDTYTDEAKNADRSKLSKSNNTKGECVLSKLAQRNTRKTRNTTSACDTSTKEFQREETVESNCPETPLDDIPRSSLSNKKEENVTSVNLQNNSRTTRTTVEFKKGDSEVSTPELKCQESKDNDAHSISHNTKEDVIVNTDIYKEVTAQDERSDSTNTTEENVTSKEICRTGQNTEESIEDESGTGLKNKEIVSSKTNEDVETKKLQKNPRTTSSTSNEVGMPADFKMGSKCGEDSYVDLPCYNVNDDIPRISQQNKTMMTTNIVSSNNEESELSKMKTTEIFGNKPPQGGRYRDIKERKSSPDNMLNDSEKKKSKIETTFSKEFKNDNEKSKTPYIQTKGNIEELKTKLASSDKREIKDTDGSPLTLTPGSCERYITIDSDVDKCKKMEPETEQSVKVCNLYKNKMDLDLATTVCEETPVPGVDKEFIIKQAPKHKRMNPQTTLESLNSPTLTEDPKAIEGDSSIGEKSGVREKIFVTKPASTGKPIKAPTTSENVNTPTLLDDSNDFESHTTINEKADIVERARTLRKRGTESPLSANGSNNREPFKQPPKVFGSASNLEINMKRRLRSPAPEAGTQSPLPKRPKMDKTRFRDTHSDKTVTVDSMSIVGADVFQQSLDSSKQIPVPSPRRPLHKDPVNVQDHAISTSSLGHAKEVALNSNKEEVAKIKSLRKNVTEIAVGNAKVKEDSTGKSQTEEYVEPKKKCFSKNLPVDFKKAKPDQKPCHKNISYNKKVNQSDKKKTKQSPDKHTAQDVISSPEKSPGCTVLSFAEWLKNNNRKEATQEQQQQPTESQQNEQSDTKGRRRPNKPTSSSLQLDSQNTVEIVTKKHSSVPTVAGFSHTLQLPVTSKDQTSLISGITKKVYTSSANESNDEVPTTLQTKTVLSHEKVSSAQEIPGNNSNENAELKTNQAKAIEPDNALVFRDNIYYTKENVKAVDNATDTNIDCLLHVSNPTFAKSRARPKMRRQKVVGSKGINKPARRVTQGIIESRVPSLSPPKQDKAKGKRTEIDILIESMSKEMKDGGIEDLLNNSNHVKRHRVSSKRSTPADSANSTDTNITSVTDSSLAEKAVNDTSIIAEISENETKKLPVGEIISQKSPIRRPQSQGKLKKSTISKESNKEVCNEQAFSIEIEKALIDEIEIKNMNTSLLEPLKCGSEKEHQQSTKIKTCPFKTPKHPENIVTTPLTVIPSKIQSVEKISKSYGEISNKPVSGKIANFKMSFKCRKLRVKLNRSLVKKYWQHLNKQEILNPVILKGAKSGSIRSFRKAPRSLATSLANPIISPVIHYKTSTDLRIQAVVSSAKLVAMPPHHSDIVNTIGGNNRESNKENSDSSLQVPPTINKLSGEGGKKEQTMSLQTSLSIPAVVGEISNILSPTENTGRIEENGRQTESFTVAEPAVPVEFKNEFLDENPSSLDDTILPDTPTLMARAHSITQAAANALSNTIMPTDIRLLTNDPMSTSTYVPSFGVTPTLVDTRGTRMYTFLHPAKYSRNHGNVLLDYCCPNLDGPMPAIDPTRIHAQIQTPVIELPAFIVLTTKVVTRAELESNSSTIPAIIRKKADKLRSSIAMHQHLSASPGTQINTVSAMPQTLQLRPQQLQQPPSAVPVMRPPHLSPAPHFSPALNALTKYLPSTTTITAKIRPQLPQSSQSLSLPHQSSLSLPLPHPNSNQTSEVSVVAKGSPLLNEMQMNLLRSNLRRFDVIFKKLVQPFDKLNFTERHQIIDNLVVSGKFLPKDLDRTIVLMEEYLKQINSIQRHQIISLNNYTMPVTATPSPLTNLPSIQMPPLQPAPNLASSAYKNTTSQQQVQHQQVHNTAIRKVQATMKQHNTTVNTTTIKQRQVPIYDTERNIIGYQLQVTNSMPAYTKSTMSSTTSGGIMSSSLDGNTCNQRKAAKRPAQDSPRVFYTSSPLQTSTPKANLNSLKYPATTLAPAMNTHKGSIVTTVRSAGPTSAGTETITTTTMATVKRVTRSRAAGSKIIIVSKSNSNEETILPDVSHHTEIKNEKDMDDFVG